MNEYLETVHFAEAGLGLAAGVHVGRVHLAKRRVKIQKGVHHCPRQLAHAGPPAKLHGPQHRAHPCHSLGTASETFMTIYYGSTKVVLVISHQVQI
jgi:hypothetical protein